MNISVQNILSSRPFRLIEGRIAPALELAGAVEMDAALLLREAGWTLHGFDYETGEAAFLDVGENTDLFRTPFCYKTQVREAKRYATLPFEEYVELSKSIRLKHEFVHFFNIGHCGSTLVHHVFNASGAAWDVSEPRFCFDLAMNRDRLPLARQAELAQAGLAFLSLFPLAKEQPTIIVKHFSQGTKSFGIWQAATPQSRFLYMHRDAVSWCNSVFGFSQRMGIKLPLSADTRTFLWNIQSAGEPETFLDGIIDLAADDLRFEDIAACAWSLHAKEFLSAKQAGMVFHAFRYNELIKDREAVLARVFAHCGLDQSSVAAAMAAFDQDAHEGEETAHDKPVLRLDDEAKDRIFAVLRHPAFMLEPDLIL